MYYNYQLFGNFDLFDMIDVIQGTQIICQWEQKRLFFLEKVRKIIVEIALKISIQ